MCDYPLSPPQYESAMAAGHQSILMKINTVETLLMNANVLSIVLQNGQSNTV